MVLESPGLVFGVVGLYLVDEMVSVLFMTFAIDRVFARMSLLRVSTLGFGGASVSLVAVIKGVAWRRGLCSWKV